MSLGKRLRIARKASGLTQKKLADMVGVGASSIANYETGVSAPNEDILINLMKALSIDANFLYADDIISQPGVRYLSHDEERLLSAYRSLNAAGRQMALTTVESYAANAALTEEALTGAS
jgi:transcriptional regulator with XRE-family HTH domain